MIYAFYCPKCNHEEDGEKKLNDPNPKCSKCNNQLEIKICVSSIRLKGQGWHKSDYDQYGRYEY